MIILFVISKGKVNSEPNFVAKLSYSTGPVATQKVSGYFPARSAEHVKVGIGDTTLELSCNFGSLVGVPLETTLNEMPSWQTLDGFKTLSQTVFEL